MTDLNSNFLPELVFPLIHVALLEPEIPPNTGNIARLCAATGSRLHLIGRLGFHLDDRNLKRAGCDFWPEVDVRLHDSWDAFEDLFGLGPGKTPTLRLFCFSAHATLPYTSVHYQAGDCLLFGPESRGLPVSIQERYADRLLCLPMPGGKVRSLNLATAAGIALYEALRQLGTW
jgi:tRNA (cytidine/uridine-2'-O-)-methyltransferase